MAKANTYNIEDYGDCNWMKDCPCKTCGKSTGGEYRLFYYPTFMNGDAEYLGSWCKDHKKDAEKFKI